MPIPRSSRPIKAHTKAKANLLKGKPKAKAVNPREAFPSAKSLGISENKWKTLRHIAFMYRQLEAGISYWSIDKSLAQLERIETEIMAHAPEWAERILRTRGEGELIDANRAFAANERAKRMSLLSNEPVATAAG